MDQPSQIKLSQLIRSRLIASLGTLRRGEPMVTMILYAAADDFSEFYIHTSRLAMHTQNILKHPQVNLMICESEDKASDPQMLARISISGTAQALTPTDQDYEFAKAMYLNKYPSQTFNFQLGDFSIYRITPKSARYVAGFGKIFNLTQRDLVDVSKIK